MTPARIRLLIVSAIAAAIILYDVIPLVQVMPYLNAGEAFWMWVGVLLKAALVLAVAYLIIKQGWRGAGKGALLVIGVILALFLIAFLLIAMSGRPWNL